MKKEFHLIVRFDSASEEMQKSYHDVVVKYALDLHAAAIVAHAAVNDGSTAPEIYAYSDDFLAGKSDMPLKEGIENLEDRVPASPAKAKAKGRAKGKSKDATKSGPPAVSPVGDDEVFFGEDEA